jgi:hypothetical protein
MSIYTDAQTLATYNSQGVAVPTSITQPDGYNTILSITSGVPFQISANRLANLYVNVVTSAPLTVTMGPTPLGTRVQLTGSQSTAVGLFNLNVPAGWYVVITGTVANLVLNAVLR